jgi:hypothetical protein
VVISEEGQAITKRMMSLDEGIKHTMIWNNMFEHEVGRVPSNIHVQTKLTRTHTHACAKAFECCNAFVR